MSEVRLSIPGNVCVHCGTVMGKEVRCKGCMWMDPMTVAPEAVVSCPLPVVTRIYDEDGEGGYEDKLVPCGSQIVIEKSGWSTWDRAGDLEEDVSDYGWVIKCMDSGHVLAIPYDDTNGPTVPCDDSPKWVVPVVEYIRTLHG